MSVNDLQIHSDHIDDGPDFTLELDEQPRKQVFIGRDNPKRFYIAVAGTLLAQSLIFFIAFLVNTVPLIGKSQKSDSSKNKYLGQAWTRIIGKNYIKPKHPLFWWAFFLCAISLILVAAIPKLGRRRAKYFFLFFICGGIVYVSMVWIAYQSLNFEKGGGNIEEFNWIYLFFFNSAFGTFLAALTSNRKPRWQVGLSVAWILTLAEIVYMWAISKNSSPNIGGIIIRLMIQAAITMYSTLDLEFMFTHRYDFYYTNDWFLGFVHLLTDWTFRFWHNLFIKRKRTVVRRPSKADNSGRVKAPEVEIVEATTPKVSSKAIDTTIEEPDA